MLQLRANLSEVDLVGDYHTLERMQKLLAVEVPGAHFARQKTGGFWDGTSKFLKKTKSGRWYSTYGMIDRIRAVAKLHNTPLDESGLLDLPEEKYPMPEFTLPDIELRPYQLEACQVGYRRRWTRVGAPTGAGKCHPVSTEIQTPDGLRIWGDLQIGDLVFGSDGRPTRITQIFDRGSRPTYRVTFRDGTSVLSGDDHLWRVKDQTKRRYSGEWVTMSTTQISTSGLRNPNGRGFRWSIPLCEPVVRPRADLPIEPYTMGALLANGGLTGTGTILTTSDSWPPERIERHHTINRMTVDENVYCPRWSLPGLVSATRELGVRVHSRQKFVPRLYLESSIPQRIALLQGLMDGDGSARPGRNQVRYSTSSPQLANDVAELVTSLGGTAIVSWRERDEKPAEGTVSIVLPKETQPFSLPRKRDAVGNQQRCFPPKRSIVSIERVADQESRCISVEASDSLYLIGREHIVTHNTVIGCSFIKALGQKTLVLVPSADLRQQWRDKMVDDYGFDPEHVGMLDGDEKMVEISTFQKLARMWKDARKPFKEYLKTIRVLIMDECHMTAGNKSCELIANSCPNTIWRVGLSATHDNPNLLREMRNEELSGPLIVEVEFDELAEEGKLVTPTVIVVRYQDRPFRLAKGTTYQEARAQNLWRNEGRNEAITLICKELVRRERRGVVFYWSTEHGDLIQEKLTEELGMEIPRVDGPTKKKERFKLYDALNDGKIPILLASSVAEVGIDYDNWGAVVNCTGGKSMIAIPQKVGRGVREGLWEDLLVFDFHDDVDRYHRPHTLERYRIYARKNWPLFKEDLTCLNRLDEILTESQRRTLSMRSLRLHYEQRTKK